MQLHVNHKIDRFCVAGISYKKADYAVRCRFFIGESQKMNLLAEAKQLGIKSVLVLSTCNRTEIYGYTENPGIFCSLLVKFATEGSWQDLLNYGYHYTGKEALTHGFRVGAGLDSQIIGDFEIAGQLKRAFAFSKQYGMVGPLLDRTVNYILQASKKIKSSTSLSQGTVSVSFAAIEWLKKNASSGNLNVLLVGTGKFGYNLLKNLLHYLPEARITLCNRTYSKACEMANLHGLQVLPFEMLQDSIGNFDAVITCTHAPQPFVHESGFQSGKKYWLLDLSVPANISPVLGQFKNINLVNIDDISALLEANIGRRMADLPLAEHIISTHLAAFYEWLLHHHHAPVVKAFKDRFKKLSVNALTSNHNYAMQVAGNAVITMPDIKVVQTMNNLMVSLKSRKEKGCEVIMAYHNFMNG